jgi:hypothetical protein
MSPSKRNLRWFRIVVSPFTDEAWALISPLLPDAAAIGVTL